MKKALVLGAMVCFQATQALAVDVYLSDLIQRDRYRKAYNAMLGSAPAVPKWLTTFNKTQNGVTTPAVDVKIGISTYEYADVCEPHSCPGNALEVVFDMLGSNQKAYGRLIIEGREFWLGDTPASIRRIIEQRSSN
jgi:hypothetical protein